jgi:prepilin-type N-terminal cleavage/methylation domain-containing protein
VNGIDRAKLPASGQSSGVFLSHSFLPKGRFSGMFVSLRKRQAFTLVELLVVIAIIGVLVALLLPAVQAAREAARRTSCANKIRQLALAVHNFHDTMNYLPHGASAAVYPVPTTGGTGTIRGTSWIVYTLPYFEQRALYDKYRFDLHYDDPINAAVGATVIPTLYCPSGPDPKKYHDPNANVTTNVTTHYYGVMGPAGSSNPSTITLNGMTYSYTVGNPATNGSWSADGMMSQYQDSPSGSVSTGRHIRLANVVDGTSNTLMLAELSRILPQGQTNFYRSWIRGQNGGSGATKNVTYPINSTFYNGSSNFNDISFGSQHPGGCQFALGDASLKFITQSIDLNIYKAAASVNGGEAIELP